MAFTEARAQFQEQLENLKKLSKVIQEYEKPLAMRITASSKLPLEYSVGDVQSLARIFRDYDQLLEKMYNGELNHPLFTGKPIDFSQREGRGDIAVLLPYNGPAKSFGLAFAPAHLYGQNVVVKPAKESQNFFEALAGFAKEEGLGELLKNPDGSDVFLLGSEKGVEFLHRQLQRTNPTKVVQIYGHDSYIDEQILRGIQKKDDVRVIFEGPGKNRFIVAPPVTNLEAVAESMVRAATYNGGQICLSAEIFDVHESLMKDLLPLVVEQAKKVKVDLPDFEGVNVGPFREKTAENIYAQLEAALKNDPTHKGATLEYATENAGRKYPLVEKTAEGWSFKKPELANKYTFVPVVVLSGVTDEMAVRNEETFGPVIAIKTFKDDHELIPQIKRSRYGLSATLYSDDPEGHYPDLCQVLEENNGNVFKNVCLFGPGGFDSLLTPWGGYGASRATYVPANVEGVPGVTRLQGGPSYTLLDFTKPKGA